MIVESSRKTSAVGLASSGTRRCGALGEIKSLPPLSDVPDSDHFFLNTSSRHSPPGKNSIYLFSFSGQII